MEVDGIEYTNRDEFCKVSGYKENVYLLENAIARVEETISAFGLHVSSEEVAKNWKEWFDEIADQVFYTSVFVTDQYGNQIVELYFENGSYFSIPRDGSSQHPFNCFQDDPIKLGDEIAEYLLDFI